MSQRLVQRIERTGDRQVDQAQRNAHEVVRRVNASPAGLGAFATTTDSARRITRDVTFTAGSSARLTHGLALPREGVPLGWFVTDVSGGYSSFQRTAWDDKTITIQSENACTARFWVFA